MKTRHALLIVVIVLVIAGLAACTGVDGRPLAEAITNGAEPAESSQPAPPSTAPASRETKPSPQKPALLEILDYSPAATTHLSFTDWTAVKDRLGMTQTTSGADEQTRLAFAKSLLREPIMTMYDGPYFLDHAANWGWDTLALDWEATVISEKTAPVYMLRFQNDDTLDAVRSAFEERGFHRTSLDGAEFFTHTLDPAADWIRTTDLAILNAAILEPDRLLILSANPESVRAVVKDLTRGQTLANDDATRSVAERLGPVDTGLIMPGPDTCLSFSVNPLLTMLGESDASAEAVRKTLEQMMPAQPLSLYTALAIAPVNASAETDGPLWKVVMHYPSPKLAEMDLTPRQTIAEQGMSVTGKMANSDLYTVQDAGVEGQDAVFWLAPVKEDARLLIKLYYQRDLPFLACP